MAPVIPCPVLVGRAAEMEVLAPALDAACAGRGGLVFVVGEAGIGKSRLVHEVCSLASRQGARVLPDETRQLLRAIHENRDAMDAFASVVVGTLSPVDFFAPQHIERIQSAATAVGA